MCVVKVKEASALASGIDGFAISAVGFNYYFFNTRGRRDNLRCADCRAQQSRNLIEETAATRASSDVRKTTEIKPELGGWLVSLLNISCGWGLLKSMGNSQVQALIPWWAPWILV